MKNILISALMVLAMPCLLLAQQDQPLNKKEEQAAIMAVIENETNCFYERDYECWKEQWSNQDAATHAWNNKDGTYYSKISWKAIDQQAQAFIKNAPPRKDKSSRRIVKREDMVVHFLGDTGAYLTWKQYNSNREKTKYTISQDFRVMEKVDGHWKIVSVSSFWDYKNLVDFDKVE